MKKVTLAIVIVLTTTVSFAETITLTSGKVIEGEIVERTDDEIKINQDLILRHLDVSLAN
ncbi:MAG: hypothetical protein IH840_12125 [Candidatus Heimdallarchaeota archaeon]|nr:hypothetical protein [Candidatus Heimdallarchaeota archaeon]